MLADQLERNSSGSMAAAEVRYATTISSSVRDLHKLVDDVLDLAKAESGTVSVEISEVSLAKFRRDLLGRFDHLAEKKRLDFSVELGIGCPQWIRTDPLRLHQILNNLLANAFAFTEHGGVRVDIRLAGGGWKADRPSLTSAESALALSVSDTGAGIDSAQHARIFEAFVQFDDPNVRRLGGTGLGLSISSALVDLFGGEISVQSAPGEGSTFTVLLPLGQIASTVPNLSTSGLSGVASQSACSASSNQPAAARAGALPIACSSMKVDSHPLCGKRMVVIDDDFRNLFALTALLERGRTEVLAAENIADAIALFDMTSDVDLILINLKMAEVNGSAAIASMRGIDHQLVVPIIALTERGIPGEGERCLEAGADDLLCKPVDTSELLSLVGRWLPVTAQIKP
jgi:two-component system chemotaxis sensor kinase CheA